MSAANSTSAALPTPAQAFTAWILARAFGHLWGTSCPRPKAVAALTGGKPLPLGELDPDGIGGIEAPSLRDGVYTHTSGSGSIVWDIDRKGVAKALVRLRGPDGSYGPPFARIEVDRRTGRAEVWADELHFENHLGQWRFASVVGVSPARPVVVARHPHDEPVSHAAGVVATFFQAFGLVPPGHIDKMAKELDGPSLAAYLAR